MSGRGVDQTFGYEVFKLMKHFGGKFNETFLLDCCISNEAIWYLKNQGNDVKTGIKQGKAGNFRIILSFLVLSTLYALLLLFYCYNFFSKDKVLKRMMMIH